MPDQAGLPLLADPESSGWEGNDCAADFYVNCERSRELVIMVGGGRFAGHSFLYGSSKGRKAPRTGNIFPSFARLAAQTCHLGNLNRCRVSNWLEQQPKNGILWIKSRWIRGSSVFRSSLWEIHDILKGPAL